MTEYNKDAIEPTKTLRIDLQLHKVLEAQHKKGKEADHQYTFSKAIRDLIGPVKFKKLLKEVS